MSLRGYKDYFLAREPKNWVEETANKWFRPDGSAKTRATTQTMIYDTMNEYNIDLEEAAKILEKAILFFTDEHVIGGADSYWEMVSRMVNNSKEKINLDKKNIAEAGVAPDAPPSVHSRGKNSGSMTNIDISGGENINFNRVFSKLEENRPADLRRLLRKSLTSGDFDDDPDFKKEVEGLHKRLSTGRMKSDTKRSANILGGQQDFVSRPSADGPDSEGAGGQA